MQYNVSVYKVEVEMREVWSWGMRTVLQQPWGCGGVRTHQHNT